MLSNMHTESLVEVPPPPINWLIENIAAPGKLSMMYGPTGMGKSLLALAFAGAMTGHTIVEGFTINRAPVLLLDAENGPEELADRLYSFSFNGQCGNSFQAFEPDGRSLEEILYDLVLTITSQSPWPRLVILDSLRSLWTKGDCNDPKLVTPLLQSIQKIAREYELAILILHHPNKNGDYAGTVALSAVPEIFMRLGKHPKDIDPNRRYLVWDKHRPRGNPTRRWFRFVEELGKTRIERASRPTKDELLDD